MATNRRPNLDDVVANSRPRDSRRLRRRAGRLVRLGTPCTTFYRGRSHGKFRGGTRVTCSVSLWAEFPAGLPQARGACRVDVPAWSSALTNRRPRGIEVALFEVRSYTSAARLAEVRIEGVYRLPCAYRFVVTSQLEAIAAERVMHGQVVRPETSRARDSDRLKKLPRGSETPAGRPSSDPSPTG